LSAFADMNNNNVRDGGEADLAGVTFVVVAGGKEVARYVTEGSSRPNCLSTVPPGAYSVQIVPPVGYVVAVEKTDLALTLGQRIDLAVAARRGEKATPTLTPTPKPSRPTVSTTSLIAIALFAGVFLVLIGVAVAIIRRGR